MSGLHRLGNVGAAHVSPADQVSRWNQDPTIDPGAAASAACQAFDLFSHGSEYAVYLPPRTRWTWRAKRDLVQSMRRVWIIIAVISLFGCPQAEPSDKVVLPQVPPDTVVLSWSVISRSSDRDSVHAVLDASREMTTTTRSAEGTMMSMSRTISKDEYADLVDRLRSLDCCSLRSTVAEQSEPSEAKPQLKINLGDVRCEIELWDREWREGRARECGFAAARLHKAGFVPDPPVDAPTP